MTWMLTATAQVIDLQFIRQADSININDIAQSLAKLCRFAGHCLRPYSVAEHSLLVCEILERDHGMRDPSALLAGLMHDAHKAYTGDLTSPMKQVVGTAWRAVEWSVQAEVHRRFGLLTPSMVYAAVLHRADLQALATERRDMMPEHTKPWPTLHGINPVEWVDLDGPERIAMTWQDWAHRFLDRFEELAYAREQRIAAMTGGASLMRVDPPSTTEG